MVRSMEPVALPWQSTLVTAPDRVGAVQFGALRIGLLVVTEKVDVPVQLVVTTGEQKMVLVVTLYHEMEVRVAVEPVAKLKLRLG